MTRRFLWLALLALLGACTAGNEVVLLPNEDGHPSTLVVSNAAGTAVLEQPGSAVAIARETSAPETVAVTDAEIKERWGAALAIHPPAPVTILLYFILDTTQLTPESHAALPHVLDLIRQRPAPEVVIVGHTDRSGDTPYNNELGLRRAEAVRRQIEAIGVPAELITVTSHGAGNPLVVPSRAYEPRNRRVEITVR